MNLFKIIVYILCVFCCKTNFGQKSKKVHDNFKLKQNISKVADKVNIGVYVSGNTEKIKKLCKLHQATYFKEISNWHYLRISPTKFEEFVNNPEIKSVHFPTEAGIQLNDTMRVNNRVIDVHNGELPLSTSYSGEGVIVGFIDMGIDYEHGDFKNSDGTTRIISLWDQTLGTASNTPQPYGYGQHWNSSEIDAGLASSHNDIYGHGTTVAGTAVGNGLANGKNKGVAYKSDIIVVEVNLETNFLTNVQDATEYIYNIADSLGKPCVINASVGTREGSHDGKDPTALFIDNLTNEKEGRIFVCSAGNDGGKSYHLKHESNSEDTIFTLFKPNPNRSWSNILSDLGAPTCAPACYGDSNVDFLAYADTSSFNNVNMSISAFHNNRFVGRSEYINIPSYLNGDYQVDNFGNYFTTIKNTNNNTIGTVFMYASIINNDVYQFRFIVNPDSVENYTWGFHTTGNGTANIWSDETNYLTSDIIKSSDSNFPFSTIPYNYKDPDSLQTIYSSFQCLPSVITVGNYVNESGYVNNLGSWLDRGGIRGEISSTSSTGPTRNGLMKPEIAASGKTTVSSFPTYLLSSLSDNQLGDGGLHYRNGGTSMSSPVVAGIAALYLEKCSQANYQNFKNNLINNAYSDEFTGEVPNYSFGYGKVDAFQTLISSGTADTISHSACDNYLWNLINYDSSGFYTFTGLGIENCDSTVVLDLTIFQSTLVDTSVASCNEFEWNGELYTESGNYVDTLSTTNGCDSIVELELTINVATSTFFQASNCENFDWNGNTYTESGIYTFEGINSEGCINVDTLELTIYEKHSEISDTVACDQFEWNGELYTESGNYIDTLNTIYGCDSVVTLNLTINNFEEISINTVACEEYEWNGTIYNESGNYTNNLNTINGCDSIINLELTINNSTYSFEQASNCGSYEWNETVYTQTGSYTDTLENIVGCDSIIHLELNIYTSNPTFIQGSSCQTYDWNGTIYTESGVYADTNQSVNGCDSLVFLNLSIHNSFNDTLEISACNSIIWDDSIYTSSGIYTNSYSTINGCDSIVAIDLTVNNSLVSPLTFELTLDWYCLETYWTIKDDQDSLWYNEGPYDCLPVGGGNQANNLITSVINLNPESCYLFELHDYYGDGLSASNYDPLLVDGNWKLKDYYGNIVMQGSGDFGNVVSSELFIQSEIISSSHIDKLDNLSIRTNPNPFKQNTTVTVNGFNGPINVEISDLSGKIIYEKWENENIFDIKLNNVSSGVYLLRAKNKSNLKPLKIIIE